MVEGVVEEGLPPKELRDLIEKTAEFVARNGEAFEQKLLSNDPDNPKFAFLRAGREWHAFYRSRVTAYATNLERELKAKQELEQRQREVEQQQREEEERRQREEERKSLLHRLVAASGAPAATAAATAAAAAPPVDAPPRPRFIIDPPFDMTAQDLDIVKLTAQFVARNGPNFHQGLLQREARNPQFDFLKPGHYHNPFFNAMVDSFAYCLLPPNSVVAQLLGGGDDESAAGLSAERRKRRAKQHLLADLLQRVKWERAQEHHKKKKEEIEADERAARSMIDWHDFVVVETITFDDEDEDDLPAPQKVPNAATRSAADDDDDGDMEMDVEEESSSAATATLDDDEAEIKVRRDYVPAWARADNRSRLTQLCPICGQDIAINDLEEHMRIELLDPRFAEEKKAMMNKQSTTSLADGDNIKHFLKGLAENRTDIFGDKEELFIGAKDDGPKKADQAIWDGHSASIQRTSNAAMSTLTIQEQIEAIHRAKGLKVDEKSLVGPTPPPPATPGAPPVAGGGVLPVPFGAAPGAPPPPHAHAPPPTGAPLPPPTGSGIAPFLPPPPASVQPPPFGVTPFMQAPYPVVPPPPDNLLHHEAPEMDDEPGAKRQKVAPQDMLVPEKEWIAQHPNPVTIKIEVGEQENKFGWLLNGQTIEVTLPVSATVTDLKEQLKERLGGMPPSKQKIRPGDKPFLKDTATLAAYNFADGTVLQLGVRERGRGKR